MADKFVLIYNAQCCYDDGGIGHDVYWTTVEKALNATTERGAKAAATRFLNRPGRVCDGSFCGARGLTQFVRIERRGVEVLV